MLISWKQPEIHRKGYSLCMQSTAVLRHNVHRYLMVGITPSSALSFQYLSILYNIFNPYSGIAGLLGESHYYLTLQESCLCRYGP